MLCFQPNLTKKLFETNVTQFVLVSFEPFSKSMHSVDGPECTKFIQRMHNFYTRNEFYLHSVVSCTSDYIERYVKPGLCCGLRKPQSLYAQSPHMFTYIRGSTCVHHYISCAFPDYMCFELRQDMQRATIVFVSRRWLPPQTILAVFDDPCPREIWLDARHYDSSRARATFPSARFVELN